ncbi:MAG: flavodoxin [Mangrovibacterium sp.]
MQKIGIFFGTTTGNAESIATKIATKINADVFDVADARPEQIEPYSKLILGTSTWGDGDMQDDWDDFVHQLVQLDLTGKTIALFGIGDSYSYPDTFAGGMGQLYEWIKDKGCHIVGQTATDGYDFEESTISVVDGRFVGLALDEDNESNLSDERINQWLKLIKPDFGF